MSWLTAVSDLAGKAEHLLNAIDQNTASALKKPDGVGTRGSTSRGGSVHVEMDEPSSRAQPREYAASDHGTPSRLKQK